jgi:predicted nucleotidyltransferase component of viral defense system
VLLEYLAAVDEALVFKGGTCLAKVYADFYRLSEDLDFVIPMATG